MNNRIKTIAIKTLEWNGSRSYLDFTLKDIIELQDDSSIYQIRNVNMPSKINIVNIYKGTAYNDTCLAELNIYMNQYGWLFGGNIDE